MRPARVSGPSPRALPLLLLCAIPSPALADGLLSPDRLCVQAVFMGYNGLTFAATHDRGGKTDDASARANDFCSNALKTASVYAAAKVHCAASDDPRDFAPVVDVVREHCAKWSAGGGGGGGGGGGELMPVPDLVANRSVEELRGTLRVVEFGEGEEGGVLEEVVLMSDAFYRRCFETIFSWQYTMWSHKRGGTMMYQFWAVVMIGAAAVQLYRRFLRDRVHWLLHGCRKALSFSTFQPIFECIERWTPESLTYERVPGVVATEKDSRSCFNFKFFPVGETLVVWMYWLLSITLNFANYRFYNESIYFPEMPHQVARYSADRTGILSYANLPMLWLFSGRNNIFMWTTGWKFPTFIRFHLHVAWIATLEAIAHSVLYTLLTVDSGIFWPWMKTDWFFMGVIGTFVMTLLLIVSTPVWLRERYYELFIDSHIISSLAVLIGLFVHTSVFDHEYDWYLWIPAFLWVLDRSLRLLRILFLNVGFKRGRPTFTKTTATYDPTSNIITLEIIPGRNIAPPRPGQYYFLYQPFSLRGYENHPMTLGTWRRHATTNPNPNGEEEETYPLTPTSSHSSPASPAREDDDSTSPLHPCTSAQPLLPPSRSPSPASPVPSSTKPATTTAAKSPATLTFWIRPYDGWTRRLRDRCVAHASKHRRHPHRPFILLEGPYGTTHALPGAYDATVLVAGGSGVSAAVPYLREHSRRVRQARGEEDGDAGSAGASARDVEDGGGGEEEDEEDEEAGEGGRRRGGGVPRVQLVWAAREEAFMRAVVRRELRGGLARGEYRARLFCTAASSSSPSPPSPSGESVDDGSGEEGGLVVVERGRPDVRAIIAETARGVCEERARARGGRGKRRRRGRVAVLLCGPAGMAAGVEAAVRSAAEEYDCWVDYFDEVFSW